MAAKKKTAAGTKEPSFEEAIAELEEIVAAMEEEELPLEDLVARFEHGTKLLGRCQGVLDSAKERLQTIAAQAESEDTEDAGGNHLTPDASDDTDSSETDDDISLF